MTVGPLNFGLFRRSLRETWGTTFVFMVIIGFFGGVLARVLPGVQERFLNRGIPPQVRQLRNALLGIDGASSGVAEIAYALAWSHPAILAMIFAHTIIYSTRVPAGEIERGTIDVLLGLPISRWQLHVSETAAWLVSAACVLGALTLGTYLGSLYVKEANRPDWALMGIVLVNLAGVYLTVGAAGVLAAACSDRRGRAVLVVLVLVVGSVLLNFLELLWEPAQRVSFLSLLHYYRPANILRDGVWPVRDLAVLGGSVLGLWVLAGVIFNRRAVTTL